MFANRINRGAKMDRETLERYVLVRMGGNVTEHKRDFIIDLLDRIYKLKQELCVCEEFLDFLTNQYSLIIEKERSD